MTSKLPLILLLCWAIPLNAQQKNCLPAVPPATAGPNIFSEEQEVFLGEAIAQAMQKDYSIIEDKALIAYLNTIGERLMKNLPLKQIRLRFFLVDLSDANAFVLPGGRVYVSRKLVAMAENEDELASVISHELGHLAAHESAIDMTRLFREVLGVTSVTDKRDIFERYNQLIDNVMRKPGAFKSGDREKGQLVADQIGFNAHVNAGYDPKAATRFWDRINETKGKTGSWFSDLFGTTRPEQRRLREMLNALSSLPAGCVQQRTASASPEYKQWQADVVAYTGSGRNESLRNLVSKHELTPPLRNDVTHIKFSRDGKYLLVQDETSINVLTREPFVVVLHLDAADAYHAQFTPDSQSVIFYTPNLRVEKWSIADKRMTDVKEIVVSKGCLQTGLSTDGQLLACVTPRFDLMLVQVASGKTVFEKKEFFLPNYFEFMELIRGVATVRLENTDAGLPLLNMEFSPDSRYFAAGYYERRSGNETALALDLTTMTKVSYPDTIKSALANGFTFMSDNRLVGINRKNTQKSPLLTFPEGKVISEHELWRKTMVSATRGDYLLIRPIKDYALGVMDLKKKAIIKVNEQSALDIYDDLLVAELRNGQVGLYRMDKNELLETAELPPSSIAGLYVAVVSANMDHVVLSSASRGGVWDLRNGKSVLALRGFRGGYLSPDGFLYADFPRFENAERNIAKFNLASGDIVPGSKLEYPNTKQIGPYLVVTKAAKQEAFLEYGHDVVVDVFDATTMKLLWSKPYPKESPLMWVAFRKQTICLAWEVTDQAVREEMQTDPKLGQQLAAMKEKEGDYFVKVLDMQDGKELGKLVIETGKGSFRLKSVYADGDWVLVSDTENRVSLYSLKTGQQKARVFGDVAVVSPDGKLLCVANEDGKLTIFDLATMESREEFVFTSSVAMLDFSQDGKKLFVLTSNQTAHVFDISPLLN